MGNSLESYRASIGSYLFCIRCRKASKPSTVLFNCQGLFKRNVMLLSLLLVSLVLLCGDIHSNPGPNEKRSNVAMSL